MATGTVKELAQQVGALQAERATLVGRLDDLVQEAQEEIAAHAVRAMDGHLRQLVQDQASHTKILEESGALIGFRAAVKTVLESAASRYPEAVKHKKAWPHRIEHRGAGQYSPLDFWYRVSGALVSSVGPKILAAGYTLPRHDWDRAGDQCTFRVRVSLLGPQNPIMAAYQQGFQDLVRVEADLRKTEQALERARASAAWDAAS